MRAPVLAIFGVLAGCGVNQPASPVAPPVTTFPVDQAAVAAELAACRQNTTRQCRDELVWLLKAYYDHEFNKRVASMALTPVRRQDTEVAVSVVGALANTATLLLRDDEDKAETAIGNDFFSAVVRTFWPRGTDSDTVAERTALMKASRREIIDWIEARLNDTLERYPLEAMLADMERYDHAGMENVTEAL